MTDPYRRAASSGNASQLGPSAAGAVSRTDHAHGADAMAHAWQDRPSSPSGRRHRVPTWFDPRLITGVLLVVASTAAGAWVFATADHRSSVWALSRDVSPGTVLTSQDVTPVRVQLGGVAAHYAPVNSPVTGQVMRERGSAGELVTRAELGEPQAGVAVAISARPDAVPRIVRGQRITVWVSTAKCSGAVVVSGVTVQDVRSGGGAL